LVVLAMSREFDSALARAVKFRGSEKAFGLDFWTALLLTVI
jgi:hypothetical protein